MLDYLSLNYSIDHKTLVALLGLPAPRIRHGYNKHAAQRLAQLWWCAENKQKYTAQQLPPNLEPLLTPLQCSHTWSDLGAKSHPIKALWRSGRRSCRAYLNSQL